MVHISDHRLTPLFICCAVFQRGPFLLEQRLFPPAMKT